MKLVIAYIPEERFAEVKQSLFDADVHRMSVSKVKGCGEQKGYVESFRGVKAEVNLLPKLKIEIGVNDSFVERAVDAIAKGARTGRIGDGKIFVIPIEECVRIRTGERGIKAIGGSSKELELEIKKNGKKRKS
jgi:nitrogen regulatory protein P-II 1